MSYIAGMFFLLILFLLYQEVAFFIAIVLGIVLFLYNFLWDIPKSLMEFILENKLAAHLDFFYDSSIPIIVLSLLLIGVWSIPVLSSEKIKTKFYKMLAIMFGVIPFVGVLTYVHNYTPEEYFKLVFNKKYEELSTENMHFNNSNVGKELRIAIDTNNYSIINKYYPEESSLDNYINKKVTGLSETRFVNKQALVAAVNVPVITEKFKKIADDNYITLEEYEQFKAEILELANFNPLKLTSKQLKFLYKI